VCGEWSGHPGFYKGNSIYKMSIKKYNIARLGEIRSLLERLPEIVYTYTEPVLDQSSIGQHFRHILEFYVCISKGVTSGIISYDARERDILIETKINAALSVIDKLIHFLELVDCNVEVKVRGNFSITEDDTDIIKSTLHRELGICT